MDWLRMSVAFLILLSVSSLAGCAPETRYRVLSLLFDGVPRPGEKAKPSKVKKRPAERPSEKKIIEAHLAGVGAKAPPEAPRPPIEKLTKWEEVLKVLPTDLVGGVDWVKAVKEGVIAPQARMDPKTSLQPPLTLDTIVPAIAAKDKPPFNLDIELTPPNAPFFKVVFPHSSHTLWLNCSSCHPGIVAKRAGMTKIFAGEYCGACHGKVAFAPATGCPRCHVNLVPPEKEAVEADLAKAKENPVPSTPEALEQGKAIYLRACVVCHGEKGDGNGPFAPFLDPKPRDFTDGTFKFRTTPSGSLPIDLDLFRTISMGLKGTAMPAWHKLPRKDRWAVLHYIKTFSERFKEEQPDPPIQIPDPPFSSPELIAKGKEAFEKAKCWQCHGREGKGDGPSAGQLKDDWGFPIKPADFTKGIFKSGLDVKDIFRSISTGLDGTPMPSFMEVLSQEERWSCSQYIVSLVKEQGGFAVKGDIIFPRQPKEGDIPPATFPHWFHRIRFRCAVCHPTVFEMRRGANPITMDAMREGKFCAKCHNGTIAWPVMFKVCIRCHVAR